MKCTEDLEKKKLFENKGYICDGDTYCYFNRVQGKIFTRLYIDGHSMNDLMNDILEKHNSEDWKIYCDQSQKKNKPTYLNKFGKKPREN